MTERGDTPPEGWDVRERPAYFAAALVPLVLLALVAGTGWLYATYLEPGTHEPPKTFPAPGVETFVHDGVNDPERAGSRARLDPAVETAKRAMLADGAPEWRE